MRRIPTLVLGTLLIVAGVLACNQTSEVSTAPQQYNISDDDMPNSAAPADLITKWIEAGIPYEQIIAHAVTRPTHTGDDDDPLKVCGNQGPSQYWELWRGSDGTQIIKWRTPCGDTYYTVILDNGSWHCFGPQGNPDGCP